MATITPDTVAGDFIRRWKDSGAAEGPGRAARSTGCVRNSKTSAESARGVDLGHQQANHPTKRILRIPSSCRTSQISHET